MKKSTSETGHAVNIANFKTLTDKCEAFGADYQPSNVRITLANMRNLWAACDATHTEFLVTKQGTKEPINERELLFEPLNKLVTRILRYLASTQASDNVKLDVKGLCDEIRGKNLTKTTTDSGDAEVDTISQSHQSYVQRTDRFKQLIALLKTIALYKPNEADLQLASLAALYEALKTANDGMGVVVAELQKALVERNNALYMGDDCLVETGKFCKEYVAGLYGPRSGLYRMVSGIAFRNLMPKGIVE